RAADRGGLSLDGLRDAPPFAAKAPPCVPGAGPPLDGARPKFTAEPDRQEQSSFATHSPSKRTCNGEAAGSLEREPGPEDFDRIEGEFRIEAALNVAGLPEAMLLAREQEIADRIAFAPQRLNHTFCLVRRHDGVLLPLEEDDRLREPIR